jgi:hypothetical protein
MPQARETGGAHLDQGAQPRGQAIRYGVRILVCRLPTKSTWLTPIEPKGVHGKK